MLVNEIGDILYWHCIMSLVLMCVSWLYFQVIDVLVAVFAELEHKQFSAKLPTANPAYLLL